MCGRRQVQLALGLAVVLAAPGCRRAPVAASRSPVRVGLVLPLSGPDAKRGKALRQAVELAVQDVGGSRLATLAVDDHGDPAVAAEAVRSLAADGAVSAVVTCGERVSAALLPVADRQRVVLVAFTREPDLCRKSPYVFAALPSTVAAAETMADYAYRRLYLRRVAVPHPPDALGGPASGAFARRFKSLGGEPLSPPDEMAALPGQLAELAESNPEAWWLTAAPADLRDALQAKAEQGVLGRLLSDLGLLDPATLAAAGGGAERALVVVPTFAPGATAEGQKLARAWGGEPGLEAALAWDVTHLLAAAAGGLSQPDGDALAKALAGGPQRTGACGLVRFAADGTLEVPLQVRELVHGRPAPPGREGGSPVP